MIRRPSLRGSGDLVTDLVRLPAVFGLDAKALPPITPTSAWGSSADLVMLVPSRVSDGESPVQRAEPSTRRQRICRTRYQTPLTRNSVAVIASQRARYGCWS